MTRIILSRQDAHCLMNRRHRTGSARKEKGKAMSKQIDITDESFQFGTWMRSEMKKLGWDMYDLYLESGVSDSTLAGYLSNASVPKLPNLRRICQAFGKSLIIEDDKQ